MLLIIEDDEVAEALDLAEDNQVVCQIAGRSLITCMVNGRYYVAREYEDDLVAEWIEPERVPFTIDDIPVGAWFTFPESGLRYAPLVLTYEGINFPSGDFRSYQDLLKED